MVIDELIVRNGTTNMPIDSYDNQMIDEIVYEGNTYHFAKQKDLVGETSVNADNAVNEPLVSLKVSGNTVQDGTPTPEIPVPIQNAGDNGIECVLRGKNLLDVDKFVELVKTYQSWATVEEVDGRKCIRFNNNVVAGKDFTPCCPTFKENTRYIFSFETRPNTIIPEDNTYDGALFMRFKPSSAGRSVPSTLSAKTTTEFTRIYVVNNANTTVTDINISFGSAHTWLIDLDTIYLYEYEGDNNPKYEPYFHKTLSLPSSVTVDGQEVQLRFGKIINADYITVDRVNNKVVYTKNIEKLFCTGSEGYTRNYKVYDYGGEPVISRHLGGGALSKGNPISVFSNYLKGITANALISYKQIGVSPGESNFMHFRVPREVYGATTESTDAELLTLFKAWLTSLNDSGNPLYIEFCRKTPLEYDLTETELGQSLLALATEKGTNILEIKSEIPVSQTELSYWRQIITNE